MPLAIGTKLGICRKSINRFDDETIRQLASDRTPLIEILVKKDIIPGIKVDRGTTDLAGFTGEKITEGLDGLRLRISMRSMRWASIPGS
jgi:fructose-bisphosphate aldolase class I